MMRLLVRNSIPNKWYYSWWCSVEFQVLRMEEEMLSWRWSAATLEEKEKEIRYVAMCRSMIAEYIDQGGAIEGSLMLRLEWLAGAGRQATEAARVSTYDEIWSAIKRRMQWSELGLNWDWIKGDDYGARFWVLNRWSNAWLYHAWRGKGSGGIHREGYNTDPKGMA